MKGSATAQRLRAMAAAKAREQVTGQLMAFGTTTPEDIRGALERLAEGRAKAGKPQRDPGGAGGLFDPHGHRQDELF